MSNKEQVFKNFLEDNLLQEKNYIKKEDIQKIKLHETSNVKIIEVIRLAVINHELYKSEFQVKKSINNYLKSL